MPATTVDTCMDAGVATVVDECAKGRLGDAAALVLASAMDCEEELRREKQKGPIAAQRIRIQLRYHENWLVLEQ